jgi:PAS domain S-box-containing protein
MLDGNEDDDCREILPVNNKYFIALTILFTGACILLFNIFYKQAKDARIMSLNAEQMIHAKQAALGIEDLFATWTRNVESLSKMDGVINIDSTGKHYMELFYEANREQIRSITRMDEKGVIVYNYPISDSVGKDISDQKHVHELLLDHKPIVSDVFKTVEGFDAIALLVPVFNGSEFKGSIGILINFENIAKRYLDVINLGETGYGWVISQDGRQLYSPEPGFTGKSVFENMKNSPSAIVMANDMVKGNEGITTFTFDRIRDRNVGQTKKYAVYMPIHIGKTFWSIAVTSAEQDVLSNLISFRNKLAFIIGVIFFGGMVFIYSLMQEITQRKQAENSERESRTKLAAALASMTDAVFVSDINGQFINFNDAFATFHKFRNKDECAKTFAEYPDILDVFMPDGRRAPLDMWAVPRALRGETVTDAEYILRRKDTGERWIGSYSFAPIRDKNATIVGSVVVSRDITKRKQTEDQLKEAQRIAELGSWYWDAKTDVTTGTEELLRIYGIDSSVEPMPSFRDQKGRCYPPDEWERLNNAVQETVRTGVGYKLDVQAIRNGIPIWITTCSEVVRDSDGQIIGLHGTVQNITERKSTEEKLSQMVKTVDSANVELRAMNVMMINRELRMVELKKEIDALCKQFGQPSRYG